jgi:predicted ATPase/DNA-binding SARP family transcriptional activator
VSVSDLVDAVWDDDPPDRARTTLQTYVSRLRAALGRDAVEHVPGGYRLASAVDTDVRAVRAAAAAISRLEPDDHAARADRALCALSRWQGPALSEFADVDWFRALCVELAELRANLVDVAAEGMLHSGRVAEAVSLLRTATVDDPFREATQILLVRALLAARRPTEAVRAAAAYRRQLADTTGLVPGAAFDAVEQLALTGGESPPPDPHLDPHVDPHDDPHVDAVSAGRTEWASAALARPTRLIGREAELASLARLVSDERLVTVCGTGGVGKSRLVAEMVAGHAGGILVVELAAVEPGDVTAALGAALGFRAGAADASTIVELLRSEDALVVFDNVEHVVDEVRSLARAILAACPHVKVVGTSRARLEMPDEAVLELDPLATEGEQAPAVELFVAGVQRARPRFELDPDDPAIAELCRRVDGVPLALELAAGRAAALGISTLVDRLGTSLDLLVDVDPARGRHATLGNVVAWSVDLLGAPARALLAALSVFHGEFDLAAAEAVGAAVVDDAVPILLGRLVDTSLVSASATAGRFRLLGMVRSYAADRLRSAGQVTEVRRAHADWIAGRLEHIDAASVGAAEAATAGSVGAVRHEALACLRSAIESGDVATATRIAAALGGLLLYRPDLELVEEVAWLAGQPAVRGATCEAAALAAGARAAFLLGRLDDVGELARRAIDTADDPAPVHRARHALGVVGLYRGRFAESRAWFEAVTVDDRASLVDRADALAGLALARCYGGDRHGALRDLDTLRGLCVAVGSETYDAFADYVHGEIELSRGDGEAAAALLTAAADRAWRVHASFVWGLASTVLAAVLVRDRPADDARRSLPIVVERWRRTATWPQLWTTLRLVAEHLAATGQPQAALFVLTAAEHDEGAPTLVGDDAQRYDALAGTLRAELGEAVTVGITAGARSAGRGVVLDRALAAMAAA